MADVWARDHYDSVINLSITIRLTDGEPVTTKPNAGTMLALERAYKLPSGITAVQTMNLEYLAWLAWEKRRHDGEVVPTWEKFRDSVEDMDFDADTTPLAVED